MIDFAEFHRDVQEMETVAFASASAFLVDGLVSDTITLWYGQSEIGKSRFVCGFVAAMMRGAPFLGRSPDRPIDRITILAADAGGDREYARRLCRPEWAALDAAQAPGLSTLALPMMAGPEYWSALRAHLDARGRPDLVILDPMTNAINGDPNNAAPVAEFYRGLGSLGCPAIVVAHSSSKPGDGGRRRGSQTPLGHSSIISSARWRVEMLADRSGQIGRLLTTGNDGPAREITLDRGPGLTEFSVTGERTSEEMTAAVGRQADERDATEKRAAVWLVNEHPGTTSAADAARLLAGRLGKKPDTIKTYLSRGTGVGRFLTITEDGPRMLVPA